MADLGTKQLSSNFGPQPGDDLTPDEFKQPPPRPSRLPQWLQRLLGSPVQPGLITDRSGESRPGITFKKPL